jgi:hypothetical protein
MATFQRLPDTLRQTRATLQRTDTSIGHLRALTEALAPGAKELPSFVTAAAGAISSLRDVAPSATATLRRGSAALPPTTRLLEKGTPFLSQLRDVLDRFTPMMGCLRPYGPELVGFLATWAGFAKNYDVSDHHSRTVLQALPMGNGSQMTSAQLVKSTPGVVYAFPRPPGFNVGQPWFIPECGVGPAALDPSKDPESVGAGR